MYKGLVDKWCVQAPLCCKGNLQSPIDLSVRSDGHGVDFGPLRFTQGYYETIAGNLINNGHSGKRSYLKRHSNIPPKYFTRSI